MTLVISTKSLFVIISLVVLAGIAAFFVLSISANKKSSLKEEQIAGANVTVNPTQELSQEQASFSAVEPTPTKPGPTPELPQLLKFDETKKYYAVLHTAEGDIAIELNTKTVPFTVSNFIFLTQKHFYDGTVFHRIIKDFMIQGGDPKGDGTGGPPYRFKDESLEGDYVRGIVAMANSGPNTNGSQFFIMQRDKPLAKNYVIFGQVVSGIEVVDKIAESPITAAASGENSKPVTPVSIKSVDISEK